MISGLALTNTHTVDVWCQKCERLWLAPSPHWWATYTARRTHTSANTHLYFSGILGMKLIMFFFSEHWRCSNNLKHPIKYGIYLYNVTLWIHAHHSSYIFSILPLFLRKEMLIVNIFQIRSIWILKLNHDQERGAVFTSRVHNYAQVTDVLTMTQRQVCVLSHELFLYRVLSVCMSVSCPDSLKGEKYVCVCLPSFSSFCSCHVCRRDHRHTVDTSTVKTIRPALCGARKWMLMMLIIACSKCMWNVKNNEQCNRYFIEETEVLSVKFRF